MTRRGLVECGGGRWRDVERRRDFPCVSPAELLGCGKPTCGGLSFQSPSGAMTLRVKVDVKKRRGIKESRGPAGESKGRGVGGRRGLGQPMDRSGAFLIFRSNPAPNQKDISPLHPAKKDLVISKGASFIPPLSLYSLHCRATWTRLRTLTIY